MILAQALDAWEKYYHANELDQLVQLAVLHAQFEIIHPFLDGNGRIGRILIPLFLHERNLLSRPMFYLSAYLESNYDEYAARLRDIGRKPDAWNHWIAFFLRAIDEQARANASTARAIMDLYEHLKARVIELTHSQYAVPLLDQIFERPFLRSTDIRLVGDQSPSRQAIASLLRILRDNGILKVAREGSGRRAHVLVFPELINLCEGKKVF